MKNLLLSIATFLCLITAQKSYSQSHSTFHEKPVIADYVPNIPAELIEAGKLSKYVALSVPDDDRWNPDSIDLNSNGAVFSIAQKNFGSCYVGGHFDSIGGIQAKGVALFDDYQKTFSAIGGGVNGDVYAIFPTGVDELYVAGNFTKAGNVDAHNIAHWTGSMWESLGSGTDSTVLALAIVAGTLYVGGNFHNVGGQPANFIAKWDLVNKTWQPILDGLINGMDGGVAAITLSRFGDLFVGGGFTKAGSVTANKIAIYSSGSWSALRSGLTGTNAFVATIADEGHVGGSFQFASGLPVQNIAYWNGSNWFDVSEFPGGFDGPVYAIATPNPIFIGGDFRKNGSIGCNFIAGSQSGSLGSGLDGPCYAMTGKFLYLSLQGDYSNHLYVGGKFSEAGLKSSANFAIWGELGGGSVKQTPSLASQISLRISPNPIQNYSNISFTLPDRMNVSLTIIDALGRQVLSLGSGWREAGSQRAALDVRTLPNGCYYCALGADGQTVCNSFVVIR